MHANEGFEVHVQHRPIHIEAIRVRTIQHDNFLPILKGRLHHVVQGSDVGVKSHTDILDIEEEHININKLRELDSECAGIPVATGPQAPRSPVALVLCRGFAGTNAALLLRVR